MSDQSDPRALKLDLFVLASVIAAGASLLVAFAIERSYWTHSVEWLAVAIFCVFLIVGEMHSVGWLRRKDAGEVTAGWAFAFTILLLGSPLAAMLAMAFASSVPDMLKQKGLRRTAFNAAQTIVSLFLATVVLTAFGVHQPISIDSAFTPVWMLAVLCAATSIFISNTFLTCTAIALSVGAPITSVIRRATRVSVSADGALLVLPPLFAIATDFSLVTLPLLALVAYLVYNSARQALEREHRASHDHLTNLLNSPSFHEHVRGHLVRSGSIQHGGCVLLLDLDAFKTLNDRLGHSVGDEVLRRVGELLTVDTLRGATGARLGGDEFAMFFADVESADDALEKAWIVARRLREPLDIGGFPISTGASIGVVLLDATMSSAEEVLRAADMAMYRAKRRRTTVEMHVAQPLNEVSAGRISLLPDLVRAMDNDELWLAYQPQIDCVTGDVVGFEALLRWNHPTRGPVEPREFIGLAEHTDLIDALTEQVLAMAARDAASLFADQLDIRVAVNVSTRNLRDRHFASMVAGILDTFQLAPSMLEIEITESAFVGHDDVVIDGIFALRSLGISVALDDFGSGYSSFSRLLITQIDCLKLDQSLIRNLGTDPRTLAVLNALIEMCAAMGLRSVAEGVESEATIAQLAASGCDVAQGFVIAEPMALKDAIEWVRNRAAVRLLERKAA